MAVKFGNSIDLDGFQLRDFVVHNAAVAPSSTQGGAMYWDTADNNLKVFDSVDSSWRKMVQGTSFSLNNAIALWDGTTGKRLANSGITITNSPLTNSVTSIPVSSVIKSYVDTVISGVTFTLNAINGLTKVGDNIYLDLNTLTNQNIALPADKFVFRKDSTGVHYTLSLADLTTLIVSGIGSGGDGFKTWVLNADSGFTWGTNNLIGATNDTLRVVAGAGIQIATDSANKAIRINSTTLAHNHSWQDITSGTQPTPVAHGLVSALHTVSGLTTGHFLKATDASSFGFAAHGLTASDVGASPAAGSSSITTVGTVTFGTWNAGGLTATLTDAGTNTIIYPLVLDRQSSGTPANGIGTGIQFKTETAAGNTEIGSLIESVTTDVTATSEDFDIVFKTMAVGAAAAERARISSTGNFTASKFNGLTISTTTGTLTLADGSTLATSGGHSLTFTTTNTTALTLPTSGTVAVLGNKISDFATVTSSELAGKVSDETGSGSLVFATSPTLVTPTLGVATATSINKVTITAPATSATLTIANGKTLTVNNTLTFSGTDSSTLNIGTGGTLGTAAYTASTAYATSGHTHGNITNAGAIGSTSGLMVITGASGVLTTLAAGSPGQYLTHNGTWATPPDTNTTYSAGTGLTLATTTFSVNYGTTAGTACQGNDSRLSDARTPLSHDLTSHTVSGLTTGHFLKALSPVTYGFAAHGLTYANVGAIGSAGTSVDREILTWNLTGGNQVRINTGAVITSLGHLTVAGDVIAFATGSSNLSFWDSMPKASETTMGGFKFYSAQFEWTGVGNDQLKIKDSILVPASHTHAWTDITSVPASLTSIIGLTYSSAAFVKMTGVNTFTLDTNTYALSSHNHAGVYQPLSTNLTSLAGLIYGSTAFVKMTAAGTFALDTNTYYPSSNPSGYTNNTGTVTSVSVTTANGVSGSVATNTTTPAITLTLGAITPTTVNGITLSGTSTPTLAVTGTSSISGANTGDNAVNSLYSGLVSNATHTGDATGATALTVVRLRGVALPALGASAGFLRYTGTGTNTWVFDTSTYITGNQSISVTGDATGSGTTAIALTLATITQSTGANFVKITLDTKGRVTGNTAVASGDITTALGYTPYNATNPSGYTSNTGTVTSVAALTLGTTGTDLSSTVATGTTTPVITLNVPTASATNRGALSAADWSTFNGKQAALNGTGFVKATGTTISYDNTTYQSTAEKGVANGYASLNSSGQVPSTQLPSYVDDVLEYANLAAFPVTGEAGKIYVTADTNKTYRWSGSAYVEISASPGSTDAVTEGTTNLYFTNARARAAVSFTAGSGAYNSTTGVFTIPTNTNQLTNGAGFITSNQSITLSGDVSGSGTTAITTTLATITQSTGSSFVKITLDTKGRVTGNTTVAASDLNSTFGSQTANTFYAAPNGTVGNPTFRAIVAADIPTLNQNTTGSAGSVANSFVLRADSGTTEGTDIYTFNGSAGKNINIIAGTNISITKAAGSWTIASTGTGLNGTGYVKMSGTTVSYIASIPNTDLANSSITVQGASVSLGGSVNVINGTGFIKASGTTISYDNSTYALSSHTHTNMVDYTGTPLVNQVAYFLDSNTIQGNANFTFNGTLVYLGTGQLSSGVVNGATAIGFKLSTPSYTTVGAKLLSILNNTTEKMSLDKDGTLQATGDIIAYASGTPPTFDIDSFKTWTVQADSGYTWGSSNVVAAGMDTVDFVAGAGITITSDPTLKAIRIAVSTGGGMVYPGAGIPVSTGSAWGTSITDNSANWNTAYSQRIATFTTTGNSGAATFSSNTLNIPTYTLAGLGGQASHANLTSLSGLSYTSPAFVKMTGANTFTLDTTTYLSAEADTLATVTGRGASTSTPVTFNGNVTLGNSADLIFSDLAGTFPTSGKGFDWTLNNDGARIYAIQPASDSIDLVFQLRDNATTNDRFVFWVKEWQGAAFDKYPLIISGGTQFDLKDSALYTNSVLRLSNAGALQNVTGNISMFTNDSGYITGSGSTSGNAGTATKLATARTLTIGSTGKTFDGSANVSWTLAEIGAQAAGSYAAASHTHVWTDITNRPTNVSSFTNDSGYITSSGSTSGSAGTLDGEDNRTISPSELTAGKLKYGFTSWGNNNTAPYADFIHLRSYIDASGGNDNLVMFRKDAIGMRIYQQTWGSATAYSTYKDVAFTDGTNSSGTWGISITGSAGSVAWANITGTPSTFTPSSHTHAIADITGLQTALDGKQAAGSYAAASHTHDDRYYTETEVGNFFSGTTAITGYNKSNWDTAFGWGNHASAGYYVGTTSTIRGLFSSSATGLTYTNATGIFSLTSGYVIPTTTEQSNWNTAFGWGNHATQGYLTALPNHNLINTTHHPVSGLTTGHFLKATGATTYGFAAHGLTHTDVGAIANPGTTVNYELLAWNGTGGNSIRVSVGVRTDANKSLIADGDVIAYASGTPSSFIPDTFKTWSLVADTGFTWGTANIVASGSDTMKLVAGSNITIQTDATGKGIKITASGGGSGMVYPTGTGIAVVSSGTSWGTTITPSTGYLRYTGTVYEWKNETYSLSSHVHGAIDNDGRISSAAVTVGNGDFILIGDVSNGSRVEKSSITIGTATNTYLRNDGTWQVPAGGGSEITHVESLASNVSINSSTAVTVLSKSLTGIATGDLIEVEINGNILNNSGAARIYVHTFTLGNTTFTYTDGTTIAASATARATHTIRFRFAILSTTSVFFEVFFSRGLPQNAGTRQSIATTTISHLFNTSTNNETGNKGIVYRCHGQDVTATQTFELRSYKISLFKARS